MIGKLFFIIPFSFCASAIQAQYPACTQIEDLTIPAGIKWIKKSTVTGYSGSGFAEWNGGNRFSGEPATADILVFKFKVPTDVVYTVMFRGRIQKGDGGCSIDAAGDDCNDVRTTANTGEWHKTMIKSTVGEWIWDAIVEIAGSGIRPREHNFKAGEEQTFYIAGRSASVQFDGVVIVPIAGFLAPRNYPADYSLKLDRDQIFAPKPTDCGTESDNEGWNFARPYGYIASVNPYIQRGAIEINTVVQPKDQWAAATQNYYGAAGVTNIYFTTLLEKEGECSYIIFVDGRKVLQFTNPRMFGTSLGEGSPYVADLKDVPVQNGSVIQVDCISNSNELVPDTDGGFNYARGRLRSISVGACSVSTVNKSMRTLDSNAGTFGTNFKIFRNPANNTLSASSREKIIDAPQIIDSNGTIIFTERKVETNQIIDLSSYSGGVYFLKIQTSGSSFVQKFLKNQFNHS